MPRKITGVPAKAFKTAHALVNAEDQLEVEKRPKVRKQLEERIKSLGAEITPVARQAAADANREFLNAALADIRKHGYPNNIGKMIRRLEKKGYLDRTPRNSKPKKITHDAARRLLRTELGIVRRGKKNI